MEPKLNFFEGYGAGSGFSNDLVIDRMIEWLGHYREDLRLEHGTVDGRVECPYPNGVAKFIKENGYACAKCAVLEKMARIYAAFGDELWAYRVSSRAADSAGDEHAP